MSERGGFYIGSGDQFDKGQRGSIARRAARWLGGHLDRLDGDETGRNQAQYDATQGALEWPVDNQDLLTRVTDPAADTNYEEQLARRVGWQDDLDTLKGDRARLWRRRVGSAAIVATLLTPATLLGAHYAGPIINKGVEKVEEVIRDITNTPLESPPQGPRPYDQLP